MTELCNIKSVKGPVQSRWLQSQQGFESMDVVLTFFDDRWWSARMLELMHSLHDCSSDACCNAC